ncbi:formate hydrogenlyase complex iron-sulfur subunit [Mannheimia massilioguelmaensis]|uniref:formate hydrogenlyase complex iron-sulfur subunit n=1 Tax=Mannheimia massilioguelmaensis TaxID=1604354 RepID=UPI0005CAAECA|nr:formate hydrogenlyase complex iron-sulfur subunit [Mannheimia massilioguelmaensis]
MFKLLKTVFKAGDVTTKYPFKPYEVDPDFRGRPELNSDQCIVCGACTIACPANALTLNTNAEQGDRTWSLFLGRCIFCGRCEEVCPTKAIRLTQDFELSVKNKQDLYQETTFKTASCQQCGTPFISYKELNYAVDLLKQQAYDPEDVNKKLAVLHTCPDCKRQNSLNKTARMEDKMQLPLSDFSIEKIETVVKELEYVGGEIR